MDEAIKVCEVALQKRTGLDYPISYSGAIDIILGEAYYLVGELGKALNHILRGLDFVKQDGAINLISSGFFTIARIQLAQGQESEAFSTIRNLGEIVKQLDPSEFDLMRAKACEAYLWILIKNIEKARACLQGFDTKSDSPRLVFDPYDANRPYPPVYKSISKPLYHWMDFMDIMVARLLILERNFGDALEIIETVSSHKENLGMKGFSLTVSIIKASILHKIGKTEEAIAIFSKALQLAEPQSRIQEFIEEEQLIAPLLDETANYLTIHDENENTAAALEFIKKIKEHERLSPSGSQLEVQMMEALTKREMEVLALLPEGLSYAQIANKLSVSENTVRTHIRGVYGKLGVNNRTQAISVARELGLLS
jgi:LuxR family maltose regulon positive regulatory protein